MSVRPGSKNYQLKKSNLFRPLVISQAQQARDTKRHFRKSAEKATVLATKLYVYLKAVNLCALAREDASKWKTMKEIVPPGISDKARYKCCEYI